METNRTIQKLLERMAAEGLDAYIIPTSDYHQSEYLADHFKLRQWISGFTGSYGTVVITKDHGHGLWTDGRYYLQAAEQLKGTAINLFKEREADVPSPEAWLAETLTNNSTVGVNGKLLSYQKVQALTKQLDEQQINLSVHQSLVKDLWEDQPMLPEASIEALDVKYAGTTRQEKLRQVREQMEEQGGDIYLDANLADIAWLYNLRGRDVQNNPVFLSYTLIDHEQAYLYVDQTKVSQALKEALAADKIYLKDYDAIYSDLQTIVDQTIIFDPEMTNYVLIDQIQSTNEKKEVKSIVTQLKAIKNPTEIQHMHNAHVKDGVAMVKFLYWLDQIHGKESIDEIKAAEKLSFFRQQQPLYQDDSFDYISGFGSNGAIVHYKATDESNKTFDDNGFYLIDSGAQYTDGTTDITRTIAIGEISDQMKKDFTLVLKGHINLATAKFINGTRGDNLDILARQYLWQQGLNYNHGTGHGVGFYLNVHEGPQTISYYSKSVPLQPGMVLSNEPGLYRADAYGIRIENLIYVADDQQTAFGTFYKFKNLTLCPIDLRAIAVDLLTTEELQWLNSYHQEVFTTLEPHLSPAEQQWLKEQTRRVGS
jgi:Xaa-Pro aminopeptidase